MEAEPSWPSHLLKTPTLEVGDMTEWLQSLAAFLENLGSIPNTSWQLTTILYFSSKVSDALFQSPGVSGMQIIHRYTYRIKKHIYT